MHIFHFGFFFKNLCPPKTSWDFNKVVLDLQRNLGRNRSMMNRDFCSKASYVSPFIRVFFLYPFIKFYSCFPINLTQSVKAFHRAKHYFPRSRSIELSRDLEESPLHAIKTLHPPTPHFELIPAGGSPLGHWNRHTN